MRACFVGLHHDLWLSGHPLFTSSLFQVAGVRRVLLLLARFQDAQAGMLVGLYPPPRVVFVRDLFFFRFVFGVGRDVASRLAAWATTRRR